MPRVEGRQPAGRFTARQLVGDLRRFRFNALEEQLNVNNQNIKEYFQNFMEARALIAQARSQYWPTISVNPAMTFSRTPGGASNAGGSAGQSNAAAVNQFLSFPVEASWVPDFFGKVRNEVREDQSAAQVSAADLENERLTEQTSLAQYYFEIRGQDALQQTLNDTVTADQKALDLTQGNYDTGVDDYISVVQARATLEAAQAAAINLGVARAQYEHAIAVLLGKLATDFSLPAKSLLIAPPPIPVGVPSQLLERRPDVAAAERTMAKDNAVVGIGYAAYYPTVTLRPLADSRAPASRTGSAGRAASFRSDLQPRRPSSTAGSTAPDKPIHRDLQCRSGLLSPDGAGRLPAGRGLSGRGAHSTRRKSYASKKR